MPPRITLAFRLVAVFAVCLLHFPPALSAAEGGFSATLSPDQQVAAGLGRLAAAEKTALDRLVAAELALVGPGGAGELAGTFASRRTETERRLAGLDRLTGAELARLNELVASVLAARPKPRERPRLKEDDVIGVKNKPEIHGAVSLTYGWGAGGRDFRAASLWLDYFDPSTGLGLGFGLTDYSGDDFCGYYPGAYGLRCHRPGPFYYDAFHPDILRDDFPYGSGQSFRATTGWDPSGRVRRRY